MKIAVVGSGVAGLAATWALNEHSEHEVHLFEEDSRPGGHANTVRFQKPGSTDGIDVDTGFIVFNPSTYPNFIRFLGLYKDIVINPTEMTFSVSRDHGEFEWAGNNLFTVFAQPSRLLDRNMWRMLYDVFRFNAAARKLVSKWRADPKDTGDKLSIGEYLSRGGYSDAFRDNYLVPMTAAIWSTPPDTCAMDFPARTLIQFMSNHHLLQITGKPSWLTLQGGSHKYVRAILEKLPSSQLHYSSAVRSVSNTSEGKIHITTASGDCQEFDRVILACHSDTALALLKAGGGATEEEKEILGAFQWNHNEVILHSDVRLMPKKRLAWSCWNYLTYSVLDQDRKRKANMDRISLTYGMNDLQHIPEKKYGPVLVTLNSPFEPDADSIIGRYAYSHPVLGHAAIQAQRKMSAIQGTRGISYAGAWMNFGFHEDGFTAGLLAATSLEGVALPFEVELVEGSSWGTTIKAGKKESARGWDECALTFAFDVFEISKARAAVGLVLGLTLDWIVWVLSFFGFKL